MLRNQSSHLTSTKESISVVINVCITYYMHRSFIYHALQNSYIMHSKSVLSSFAFSRGLVTANVLPCSQNPTYLVPTKIDVLFPVYSMHFWICPNLFSEVHSMIFLNVFDDVFRSLFNDFFECLWCFVSCIFNAFLNILKSFFRSSFNVFSECLWWCVPESVQWFLWMSLMFCFSYIQCISEYARFF